MRALQHVAGMSENVGFEFVDGSCDICSQVIEYYISAGVQQYMHSHVTTSYDIRALGNRVHAELVSNRYGIDIFEPAYG
nr:hypothetical protein CFP56_02854 [Quercus suber]